MSGLSHAVAAVAIGMSGIVLYWSLKGRTSQYAPVKWIAVKLDPKHVVSVWLSISDLAILSGVVFSIFLYWCSLDCKWLKFSLVPIAPCKSVVDVAFLLAVSFPSVEPPLASY
jgi:hypothetical protein